ncbi:MAG: hypothetical protein IPI49_31415 [Myxococcales bacterium]|nr:hypothetical protein [Myxococcales bacterium]
MRINGIHFFGAAALLVAACSDGGSSQDLSLAVQFAACGGGDCPDDGEVPPPPAPPAGVTCAAFMIRDVRLDGASEFDQRVWEPVDLLDPATSKINLLQIQPGTYDRVRLTIEPQEGFRPGPTGRKVSTILCITLDGKQVEYRDDTYDTFELRPAGGVVVEPGRLSHFLVTFDLAAWFEGIDVSQLTPDETGIVHINERSHHELQNTIRDRIKDSVDAVRGDD